MKHKQKLLTIILFGLSLCLLTGCSTKMFKSGDDMLDEAAIATLKALEKGDAKAIKKMFSKEALEKAENIDDEIEAAIDFFEGSVKGETIDDFSPAHSEHKTVRHGVVVAINDGFYTVETDEAYYEMRIELCSRNDNDSDVEGILTIEIVPYLKKQLSKDFKWQAYWENGDAGVFIQEEEEKEDKEWKPNLNLRVKP